MADVMSDRLYEDFMKFVKSGDEAKAREFLATHLKEFPKEDQSSIVMAFFQEAILKGKEDADLISNFQKQGLGMIDEMEKAKAKLEDKAKLIALKKKI